MVMAYREVYFLQLQDNYCRMIYPDDTLLNERGNYEAMVNRHFKTGRILHYDEENVRQFLSLENLRSALQNQNSVDYRYRRSSKENPDEWCLTSATICEREDGKPKTAVITIQSIDRIIKEEEEARQARMVQSLASMSDAFFIYRAMEDERILYANPAMMDVFGCQSMCELMELVGHSFRGIVHPEDLERVEWEIENQIQSSDENMDYVQYRIIRKDGEIRWVDDWGHLESSKWGGGAPPLLRLHQGYYRYHHPSPKGKAPKLQPVLSNEGAPRPGRGAGINAHLKTALPHWQAAGEGLFLF